MKFSLIVALFCSLLTASSCLTSVGQVPIKDLKKQNWFTSGETSFQSNVLTLVGTDSYARLKKGNYQDFDLSLELRTRRGGKGYVSIHTDQTGKGHRIAIDNDLNNAVWWKKTGSLITVRNLTKSLAKDNEWFQLSIKVQGQRITVEVNRQLVVDYTEPVQPLRLKPNRAALLSAGTIAITSTGKGEIDLRRVSISELDSKNLDKAAQLAEAIDEQTDPIIRLHQEDFPVLDYHVHLKGTLTKNVAAAQSRKIGINYAIAPNAGVGFPLHDDDGINRYLDTMKNVPFLLPMQAEGRDWVGAFSEPALKRFDFLFTDAETFTDLKGRKTRLWVENEVFIDNEQAYMELIVDKIIGVLQEPVDIYVNPFFLPKVLQARAEELWTPERKTKVITALAKSGKAMEINNRYKIPSAAIIQEAKAAGIKFSFGTNNVTSELGKLEYCLQMKEKCLIQAEDMYKPRISN
ncbi:DUF1080 domain-containing protein [Runella limosa]|uniref:DUF1080 domain-containing protein n=1 Tax=Runella limosa TaxID=370978 RepID=UPI000401DAF0|nr:DUF1080 domain-containing protein [Runella limosa]